LQNIVAVYICLLCFCSSFPLFCSEFALFAIFSLFCCLFFWAWDLILTIYGVTLSLFGGFGVMQWCSFVNLTALLELCRCSFGCFDSHLWGWIFRWCALTFGWILLFGSSFYCSETDFCAIYKPNFALILLWVYLKIRKPSEKCPKVAGKIWKRRIGWRFWRRFEDIKPNKLYINRILLSGSVQIIAYISLTVYLTVVYCAIYHTKTVIDRTRDVFLIAFLKERENITILI